VTQEDVRLNGQLWRWYTTPGLEIPSELRLAYARARRLGRVDYRRDEGVTSFGYPLAECEEMIGRHRVDRPDIVADLRRRAEVIAEALATAFGGRSQVGLEDIGRAVAGQIVNNGLTVHGTVEEICVTVYEAMLYPGDEPDYEAAIPLLVEACLDRLAEAGSNAGLVLPNE
jgi:hypothetical protein